MLKSTTRQFRKQQARRMCGVRHPRQTIALFGPSFALQAQECGLGSQSRQIEPAAGPMTRYVKRGGKIWIRIIPRQTGHLRPAKHGWAPVRAKTRKFSGWP